jgi:hypothetical protein
MGVGGRYGSYKCDGRWGWDGNLRETTVEVRLDLGWHGTWNEKDNSLGETELGWDGTWGKQVNSELTWSQGELVDCWGPHELYGAGRNFTKCQSSNSPPPPLPIMSLFRYILYWTGNTEFYQRSTRCVKVYYSLGVYFCYFQVNFGVPGLNLTTVR